MDHTVRAAIDIVALLTVVVVWFDHFPAVAAVFATIWYAIQIIDYFYKKYKK